MIPVLAMMQSAIVVNENFIKYPLVPPDANQGWKLELFEVSEDIPAHYHKIQRQFLLIVEGSLKVVCNKADPVFLQKAQIMCIDPGTVHSLHPQGKSTFFAIDLPGFSFPEDVFEEVPEEVFKWSGIAKKWIDLDEKYFKVKIDLKDYVVYEIASDLKEEKSWSVALLEIHDSPRHFHRIEQEQFIVMSGVLDVEVDGVHHEVKAGESICITPRQIHQLKSVDQNPVRVLCFSFPAFDPTDMYFVPK